MKKTLSIILALAMVLALLPTVALADYYDDTDGHWAEEAINKWTDVHVVNGEGDGGFHPDAELTRAEGAQIFVNLLQLSDLYDLSGYTDVPVDEWYYPTMSKIVASGIMGGMSFTTLEPDTSMTREMLFVMIARTLGIKPAETTDKAGLFEDFDEISDWAQGLTYALMNMDILGGVDSTHHLAPGINIDRASTITVVDRLIGTYANVDGTYKIADDNKLTLVVAKNVTLTGTYGRQPIVLYGTNGTVNVSNVRGTATYNVMVPGVKVYGAAVGTVFNLGPRATGLVVNGVVVPAGTTTYTVTGTTPPTTNPPGDKSSYTVTYYSNYPVESGMPEETKPQETQETTTESKPFEVLDCTFTVPENYKFDGWQDNLGNPYVVGSTGLAKGDLKLYAKWVGNYKYDITYNYNYPQDVTGQPADVVVPLKPSETKAQTFTTMAAPTLTGYTFINWVDQDGVGYNAGAEYTTEKSLTLKAQWVNDTDFIAHGVSGAITAFNEKYKEFETLSDEGYALSVSQIAYNGTASEDNTTREQKLLVSASLDSDIAERIITVACATAANFLDTGKLDTTEAEGIVEDVLAALEGIGITSFRDRAALKKQLTDAVKAGAGVVSTPFKNYQDSNYCFTEASVQVGGETVKVTTNAATASVVGSRREAVKKLAVAIAKHLYNDLSKYANPENPAYIVTLTAKVEITFTPKAAGEFPTKYPFDVTLTLDGGDFVSVTWDANEKVAHLKVDAAAGEIAGAYEDPVNGVPSIINGLLSPDAIQNSMSGSKDSIFTKLAEALESLGIAKKGEGSEKVNEALEAWVKDNRDYLLTPGYDGDYFNTAFEGLVKQIADAAAKKFADEMVNGEIPEILVDGLKLSATPINLLELVQALEGYSFNFDFSALTSLDVDIRDYIFDAICQEIRTNEYVPEKDYEGAMKSALQENVKTQVNSALTSTGLKEVLPILSNLKSLKGAASLTLGDFKTLVSNKTVQDMAPEGVTGKVPTIKNALNRLPANASVTVEVNGTPYTLSTDDLKGLNEKGLVKGFQDLVKDPNKDLKLNDFDTENDLGLKVTLNYKDSRYFTFYLEIDGLIDRLK